MTDRTFSYQPGGWFGIVGEHATVLLPGSEKARAGSLWALVDDGAGFDAVLDALVADGLTSLPGFVLLASDGDTTRVVIRGDASATFETAEGTVQVAGSGMSMWVERVLHEVGRLSVTLPGELPSGPQLQVAAGLIRLAGLETPVEAAAPAPGPTAPPPSSPPPTALPPTALPPTALPPTALPPTALPPTTPPPRLELVPDPLTDEIDLPAPEDEAPTDDDVLGEPPSWTPPAAVPPLPPVPPAPTLPPPPPLPTIPPLPTVPPPPGPPPVSEWDDALTEQIPAMTPPPPPVPEPEPEPEPEPSWERPGPVAHLSFSSGNEIDVDGLVVIGRAPGAGRFPADEEPMLVTVPSPHAEISSTHLEVRPGTGDDHGSAVVTDLGSTNGTLLVQPGQRPEELRPGVPVVLQIGAMIDLGDGLTIRVSEA
ncbi:FHA domain-containing protein [Nocardioides panacihumi]|uniref:FHA domain-containing protein n=1 Tax=Nocardioides panacihumi TaxID=400774 RepID=UPI0031CF9821